LHPLDIFFWACLMLGGVYTLFNLFMGGLSHAAGHVSQIGHSLHIPHVPDLAGHISGHAEAAHTAGGAHALPAHGAHGHAGLSDAHAHAHAANSHGSIEEGGPRFNLLAYFNPMSVAGFLVGFGGAGALIGLLNPEVGLALRLAFSIASGWALWLLSYLLITRVFGFAEGTSHNLQEQCIGLPANVTAPINGSHPGMISYAVAGSRQTLRAITDEDEQISVGSIVRIRKITANTAYVTATDQPPHLLMREGL
jgi:membrane protein implicated in regulation of membrane protease activity